MNILSIMLAIELGNPVFYITGILVILFLLLISAAMSASEVAYFSLSAADLNDLKNKKTPVADLVINLINQPKKLLATILIANNFVNVGVVIISTFLVSKAFDFSASPVLGFLIQVIVITSIILLAGEIIPKVYATKQGKGIVLLMARPLRFLSALFLPLSILLTGSTNFIDKRLARKKQSLSMDDLSDAIDITGDGISDENDRKIMKSITRFGDLNAREIMTPRVDVTAIDVSDSFSDVKKTIIESGFSRIPVYEDSPDKVSGVLYIKDVLPHVQQKASFDWKSLVRPAFFIPENKPINDLLDEFREKKIHLAVVVDEYGGTSGIITMEDIIEEILGDINDEFDTESDGISFNRINDNIYVFDGKTMLIDVCRIMGIEDRIFDEARGESDTLAGLILELNKKMPVANEKVQFEDFKFVVESVDRRRVKRIRVIMPEEK